jgi:hypothetical protein
MKTLNKRIFCSLSVALTLAINGVAGENTVANPCFAVLSKATAAELPAKSAELVLNASARERAQTTMDAVKAAVPLNPAAAPAIVGSIAQACPDMAAIAAATAITMVPDQAAAIASAAAAAVPAKAGKIVEAMCHVLPAQYQKIANAVAEAVPGAGKDILTGVSAAIPALKDPIKQVLLGYNGNVPSVSSVLDQVKSTTQLTAATTLPLNQTTMNSPILADPVSGPPYVPNPPHYNNLNPGSGNQVPVGGRNYASP